MAERSVASSFLDAIDAIIQWPAWLDSSHPHYYDESSKTRGRRPVGLEVILRIYLPQSCFTLSDEGVEDAIYDSYAMRTLMGVNFVTGKSPDAIILLHFRQLMEEHKLSQRLLRSTVS